MLCRLELSGAADRLEKLCFMVLIDMLGVWWWRSRTESAQELAEELSGGVGGGRSQRRVEVPLCAVVQLASSFYALAPPAGGAALLRHTLPVKQVSSESGKIRRVTPCLGLGCKHRHRETHRTGREAGFHLYFLAHEKKGKKRNAAVNTCQWVVLRVRVWLVG